MLVLNLPAFENKKYTADDLFHGNSPYGKILTKKEPIRTLGSTLLYLTIIPWAQIGYESIAHEAEGRMGYWLRAHEGERNNCFSKIQLVGQKNIETKHLSLVKAIILVFKAGAFRY